MQSFAFTNPDTIYSATWQFKWRYDDDDDDDADDNNYCILTNMAFFLNPLAK